MTVAVQRAVHAELGLGGSGMFLELPCLVGCKRIEFGVHGFGGGQAKLEGSVRIGMPDDYAERFLPEIMARFSRSNPRVELSVLCEPTTNLIHHMRQRAMSQLKPFPIAGMQDPAFATTFTVGDDLRSGRLQAVLTPYVPAERTLYAVYLPNRHLSAKVRAFIDFLLERFAPPPYWDRGWSTMTPQEDANDAPRRKPQAKRAARETRRRTATAD